MKSSLNSRRGVAVGVFSLPDSGEEAVSPSARTISSRSTEEVLGECVGEVGGLPSLLLCRLDGVDLEDEGGREGEVGGDVNAPDEERDFELEKEAERSFVTRDLPLVSFTLFMGKVSSSSVTPNGLLSINSPFLP